MKTNLKYTFKMMSLLVGLTLLTPSCEYKSIVDVEYPAGLLYLPAAINGVYTIDALTQKNLAVPTPGELYRYKVNTETNRFEVPLGVFRSGVNPGGEINVNIEANPTAVSELIDNNTLTDTEILPADKYDISITELEMAAGADHAVFNISVDFAFLKQHAPQKYAFAISISSSAQETNPNLGTVVVLIDTKILIPKAQFTAQPDDMDSKKIAFKSGSTFALAYAWNFGDGQTSTEENPVHAYETAGDYNVELTVTGLCGDTNSFQQTVQVM